MQFSSKSNASFSQFVASFVYGNAISEEKLPFHTLQSTHSKQIEGIKVNIEENHSKQANSEIT